MPLGEMSLEDQLKAAQGVDDAPTRASARGGNKNKRFSNPHSIHRWNPARHYCMHRNTQLDSLRDEASKARLRWKSLTDSTPRTRLEKPPSWTATQSTALYLITAEAWLI